MQHAWAVVLPEDRIDALYHSYDGGGITVNGPSVLVRKSMSDSVSVSANYYVDSISSASVDVVASGASRYSEERTQKSVGVDYLNNDSIMSYSYTTSIENDYEATTSNFSISQEMFGGLTTVSLGFKLGDNVVMNSTDATFREDAETRGYRLSVSQVLTKNMLLGTAYEIITDQGFLNNPYRSARYLSQDGLSDISRTEQYPDTHTSNALGFSLRYYLTDDAAVYGGYRYYIDSWEIQAHTLDFGYVMPYEEQWLLDFSGHFYTQSAAFFYSDLFDYATGQDMGENNYVGRDKELGAFNSYSFGVLASYDLAKERLWIFEKGRANIGFNYFIFNYDNFRDLTVASAPVGQEPLYQLTASVIRLYLSLWF